MATHQTEFVIKDRVIIDGCESLVVVTSIRIYHAGVNYLVSWVDSGKLEEQVVDEWRLSPA